MIPITKIYTFNGPSITLIEISIAGVDPVFSLLPDEPQIKTATEVETRRKICPNT